MTTSCNIYSVSFNFWVYIAANEMRILCILVFLNLEREGRGLLLTTYVLPVVSPSTAAISPRIPASAGFTCVSGSAQRHDKRDTRVVIAFALRFRETTKSC
jgi:hypothetical protein